MSLKPEENKLFHVESDLLGTRRVRARAFKFSKICNGLRLFSSGPRAGLADRR
jgi:aspartate ammonia-lyase